MDAELKAKWVVTLRSGNYQQSGGQLRDSNNYCCCLGVLCDIAEPSGWKNMDWGFFHNGHDCLPSYRFLSRIGLPLGSANELAHMNDHGVSFAEIADWIEQNL